MKMISRIKIMVKCFIVMLLLGACQDVVTYDDNYDDGMTSTGAPVIKAVYDAEDREMLLPITDGNLEQMIVIEGSNLSNVTKVMFNDVELSPTSVYATASRAYLPIPRQIPLEVTDKLYYETELGKTSYDFSVSIPLVQVEGLYNEFALPGTSVQLKGKYFDLYGFGGETATSTITMNGVELVVDSITDKYLSVIIPEGAQDNSVIEINYVGAGGSSYVEKIPYRMTNAIIWDLANPDNHGLWAGKDLICSEPGETDPELLFGPYFRVKGSYGAWSWNNLPCGGFNCPADVAANPADYNFKFEVYSPAGFPFYDSASFGYLIELNGGHYAWNPSANGSFNTYDKWCTVTLDLQSICSNAFTEGWTGLSFILQPNSDWNVDHSFANIRLEKKIKP